jgi:hypothetical protein
MLQMSFREDGQDEDKQNAEADETHDSSTLEDGNEGSPSRRPRRAAAQLAAHTIRVFCTVLFFKFLLLFFNVYLGNVPQRG